MKVRIYKPHTHAGKRYTPGPDGIEIEVDKHDAAFLDRAGVTAKPAADGAAPATDPEADIPAPLAGTTPPTTGKK